MFVSWPWGPLLVGIQVSLSALAGIYTENIYKKYGKQRSIHMDNLGMYLWGAVANYLQYAGKEGGSFSGLTFGFNKWAIILVFIYATHGLLIAQVMKYFSNIVKLFMQGASILVAGFLTWFIFDISWTTPYMCGLAVVTFAVFLYRTERKFCE